MNDSKKKLKYIQKEVIITNEKKHKIKLAVTIIISIIYMYVCYILLVI